MRMILGASLLATTMAFATPCIAASPDDDLRTAEAVIDDFYSFDATRLDAALAHAPASKPAILYYQGWARGGNYRVVARAPCSRQDTGEIACAITVADDLVAALGIGFDVTDTFHLTFADGRVQAVRTSSNDPELVRQAFDWVKRERADLVREPCRGFFDGGPTPAACAEAVRRGLAEFAARR